MYIYMHDLSLSGAYPCMLEIHLPLKAILEIPGYAPVAVFSLLL